MTITVTPVDGDGALISDGRTVVFVAPPVDPALLAECRRHLQESDATVRLRSLAGAFLGNGVSAAAIEADPQASGVGDDGGGWSVFAVGAIDVVAHDGRHSAGTQPTGVSRRFAAGQLLGVVTAGAVVPSAASWERLRVGTIRAGGVAIVERDAVSGAAAEPSVPEQLPPPPVPPASPVADPLSSHPPSHPPRTTAGASDERGAEPVDAPPFDVVSLSEPLDLADRAPLPVERAAPAQEAAGVADDDDLPPYARPQRVLGVLSPRGYFNHPDALYCSRTGVKMGASATKVLVEGDRPPLGVLTFDDGSTLSVQWPLVFGREPGTDDGVAAGTAAGHRLQDERRAISRVHLRIELVDWDVLLSDAETANGTWIQQARDPSPRRLGAGERVVLRTGDRVYLGDRSFTYHDHHTR